MMGAPVYFDESSTRSLTDEGMSNEVIPTADMPHRFENQPSSAVLSALATANTAAEVDAALNTHTVWLTERLNAKMAGSSKDLHRMTNVDSSLVLAQLANAQTGPSAMDATPSQATAMSDTGVLDELAKARTSTEIEAVIDNNSAWLTEHMRMKMAGSSKDLHRMTNVDSSLVLEQLANSQKGPSA